MVFKNKYVKFVFFIRYWFLNKFLLANSKWRFQHNLNLQKHFYQTWNSSDLRRLILPVKTLWSIKEFYVFSVLPYVLYVIWSLFWSIHVYLKQELVHTLFYKNIVYKNIENQTEGILKCYLSSHKFWRNYEYWKRKNMS